MAKSSDLKETEHLILRMPAQVTSADADLWGRIKPGALVNLLIQAAIRSADQLGFGFDRLRQQNLFWVLSRLTIRIDQIARWPQLLIVETWPKDIDRLYYLRDFFIIDEEGHQMVAATSAWLAINAERKRPSRVENTGDLAFTRLRDKQAIRELPEKLPALGDTKLLYGYLPLYTDFDVNGHVTATRYVDLMCNALPVEFWSENYPSGLAINYLRETLPGTLLDIRQDRANPNHFAGHHSPSGETSFLGKLQF